MSTFIGKGNLGAPPSLKYIKSRGRDLVVAEMRVFFGRHKLNDQTGEIEQVGGYWMPVSIYDAKAEAVAKLLRKGARVKVEGELREFIGKDDDGKESQLFQIVAEDVTLVLTRVESIAFKQREEAPEPA